jgi:hypothetical protein
MNWRRKKTSFFLQAQYRSFARIARKVRARDFLKAESFASRDVLLRILAGEAYDLAQKFAQAEEEKISLQYMKLTAKLLGMSLRPKKLSDLEEIKKALAALKDAEKKVGKV